MPATPAAANLPLDQLADACAEQTRQFNRREPSTTIFCFELLRRALAEGLPEAFTRVHRIYARQIVKWVYQHASFEQASESAEFFANLALTRFYFALRGPKFAHFETLAQVLAYLKACVHTAVAQYVRDHEKVAHLPLEAAAEAPAFLDPGETLEAEHLWADICALLPDERDRWLARSAFVLDLKPKAIAAANPGYWHTEREVTLALYRVRQRLRGDPGLRERMGLPAATVPEN